MNSLEVFMKTTVVLAITVCVIGQTEDDVDKLYECAGDTRYAADVLPTEGELCTPECDMPNTVCVSEDIVDAGATENFFCDPLPESCYEAYGLDPDVSTTKTATTTKPKTTTEPEDTTTVKGATTTKATDTSTSPSLATTEGTTVAGQTNTGVTSTTPAVTGEGVDAHLFCCKWAGDGECDKNPAFVRPVCQKSCGTVGCRVENAAACKVMVNVDKTKCMSLHKKVLPTAPGTQTTGPTPVPSMTTTAQISATTSQGAVSATTGGAVVDPKPNCLQLHDRCAFWSSIGECEKNPFWMKINCQQSCNCCGCTYASIAGLTYTANCRDHNELCPFWASIGQCTSNRNYMRAMCRAACAVSK